MDNDTIQMMKQWCATPLGHFVLREEAGLMSEMLCRCFGYYLLQLGIWPNAALTASLPIKRQILIEQEAQFGHESGILANLDALPLQADSIDVAVLPHSLEFVTSPQSVLREVERILVPEGHILIVGFNPWSIWGVRRQITKSRFPWCGHFLSANRLKDWLMLLGFDILRCHYRCFCLPFQQARLLRPMAKFETLAKWSQPLIGGLYCILAKKAVVTLTPVRLQWRMKRKLIGRGVIEPSARS